MGHAARGRLGDGMVRLLVLGSSCLVSTEGRRPTQLVCLGSEHGLLIDCGVSPRGRLEDLGVGRDAIDDIFITHFHPDHVAGLPLYLMELCLRERQRPMRIHAGKGVLTRIRTMMDMYRWRKLPDQFPIAYRTVKYRKCTEVLSNGEFRVQSTPVHHVVPSMAVRVEILESGKSFVYSADTEPSPNLVALARDAGVLLHEATGKSVGHSSAAQAASVARDAHVRKLLLIHTDPYADPRLLIAEARAVFPGEVGIAEDRMPVEW
jgi:ribonuclease Z